MPASRAVPSGHRRNGVDVPHDLSVRTTRPSRNFVFCLIPLLLLFRSALEASTLLAGAGTNSCTLQIQFSSGDQLTFTYRFGENTIRAQNMLESMITATGGTLLSTSYLTDFSSALSQSPGATTGLIVQYQSSLTYPDPYINGILWAPTGASNGDYLSDTDWWQIWVQGPAQLEQPYAETAPPLDLTPNSGWVSPPASGLKDIILGNGASLGLVYGSTNAPPSLSPSPAVKSSRVLAGNQLEMTFSTVPNLSYHLQCTSNLNDDRWATIESLTATSTSTVLTVPMTNSTGRAFFRLSITP